MIPLVHPQFFSSFTGSLGTGKNLRRLEVLTNCVYKIKPWTDQMAMASEGPPFHIAYQFNGNRLQPIHLHK